MKARQMLEPNERVVVIYTRGPGLVVHPDRTGFTQAWKVDPRRDAGLTRVFIYRRDEVNGSNKLYVASVDRLDPTPGEADRYTIVFSHCQFAGITSEDWPSFADIAAGGGQNPVRYLP